MKGLDPSKATAPSLSNPFTKSQNRRLLSEAAPVLYGPVLTAAKASPGISPGFSLRWLQLTARYAHAKDLHCNFLPLPTAALPLLSLSYANPNLAVFFLQIIQFSKTLGHFSCPLRHCVRGAHSSLRRGIEILVLNSAEALPDLRKAKRSLRLHGDETMFVCFLARLEI